MNDDDQLKSQYLEAIRLHLWYAGSKFSFFQGKASKELAERYRALFHKLYEEFLRNQKR